MNSIFVQMVPGPGDLYQAGIILVGYDPIAGVHLTDHERQDAAATTLFTAGLAPALGSGHLRHLDEFAAGPGRATARDGLASLARFREQEGMPIAGSADDAHTAARLDIGDATYFGRNGHNLAIDIRVNPGTASHAEGHAFQQAKNDGVRARSATMYVDRPLCGYCGKSGGLGSLMRGAGVQVMLIVTPEGKFIVSADRPFRPIRVSD